MIQACWQRQGNDRELFDYLGRLYRDLNVVPAAVAAAVLVRDSRGATAALDYLLPVMEKQSNAPAIGVALEWLSEERNLGSDKVKRLADVVIDFVADHSAYHCEECGFHGAELHWRCPSCQHWGGMVPT